MIEELINGAVALGVNPYIFIAYSILEYAIGKSKLKSNSTIETTFNVVKNIATLIVKK